MGIYIRGMEMPTEKSCIIQIYPDGSVRRLDGGVFNSHFNAFPVPPHGKLIDADVLHKSVPNFGFGYRSIMQGVIGVAPTIIPASEKVYDKYTDTAGNLHWTGTKTGKHIIPAEEVNP